MTEVGEPRKPSMISACGFGTAFAAMVMVMSQNPSVIVLFGVRPLVCVRPRLRRPNPEGAPLLHPRRALVAQQGAANFSGIVARRDGDDLEALGVLVTTEPVLEEFRHAVGDGLTVRIALRLDDGVHALAQFR